MPFSFVNNHTQYYATAGAKNKPALLFSNSLGSDLRIWDSVAERLSANFRIVRYDIRGHGLSEATEPPYSADDLAKDVVGLFDLLDISQAVVCGVSVGGLIAQAVALNYPARVRSLILCDTGARSGTAARIKSPTLVLTGAEDVATPPDLGRELASLISGAQFSLIEGAGHLPCIEQPETMSEQILQFLQEVHIV